MAELSRRQRQVLRKCKSNVYEEFGKSDREICDYLCSEGFVENKAGLVFITEKGKAILQNHISLFLWRWIPIVISVVALIRTF